MAPNDPAPADVDLDALRATTERCFELAMTDGIAPEAQAQFLANGQRLRKCLVRLAAARFESRTPALVAANAALASTHEALQADLQRVEDATAAIQEVTDLVAKLDQALSFAKLI